MIKLTIISLLCIALSGPVLSKISEKKIGEDGWHFIVDIDDNRSCEDKCLATKNSKKISDATLYVLHAAKNSYNVLEDLLIIDFMYGQIDYKEWASNIKSNDFDYEGYEKLQNLVKRYRVCKKVCKVYSQFRKALKDKAGDVKMYENDNADGTKDIEVNGDMCVLADMKDDLERFISQDRSFNLITFNCPVCIADTDLDKGVWSGMNIKVNSKVFIAPVDSVWDVTAGIGKFIKTYISTSLESFYFSKTKLDSNGNQIGRDGNISIDTEQYESGDKNFTILDNGGQNMK